MKKFLKIFAVAAIAVAAAIACVFAGCNNKDNGNNGGEPTTADYTFTLVYEGGAKDGQAVNGQTDGNIEGKVMTQICVGSSCRPLTAHNLFPDANGKLSLTQAQVNTIMGSETDVTEFVFHAVYVTDYKDDCEINVNGKGNYTLKITVS